MATKDLVIDSGLVTYNIKDHDGRELGQFTFNPSDTDIVKRHKKVVEKLQETMQELEIMDEQSVDFADALEKVDDVIYEQINYLLSSDVAESFFSIMGPFSPLKTGEFFVEAVLNTIGQAIEIETGERVKKIQGKVRKHTSKYHG